MFRGWTPIFFLGRVFGVLFRSPACGRRFGSGPGRFWVGVCRPWFCPKLCSVSVGSNSKKKRAPTQKPAVITDHFMSGIPSCSMFWDFGSLHQKHRASAGHLVVYFVMGLMVGDRRFPRGDNTGGRRFSTSSANHPLSVPPTGPEHADASWCGQCSRWQVQCSQTGATLRRHFLRGLVKFTLPSGRGHLFPAPTWEGRRATL